MSALISCQLPLIEMSAAHNMTARGYLAVERGYPIGRGRLQEGSSWLQTRPDLRLVMGLDTVGEPFVLGGTATACLHSFTRRVYFAAGTASLYSEAAKLDAAIAANLKELGYGG